MSKNKSTYAPQFELPGTEIAFNLRGEVQTTLAPRPQPREDKTREMFLDHAAIECGRAIIAGEMAFED